MPILLTLIGISLISMALCRYQGIPWRESLLSILFLFPMPFTEMIGRHFPMFFSDLVIFVIPVLYYKRKKSFVKHTPLFIVCLFLLVIIPIISTFYSQIAWQAPDSRFYLYIYRRSALFFLFIIANRYYKFISVGPLINAAVIFWFLISLLGFLSYIGINTLPSFIEEGEDYSRGSSVFENYKLVRGFLSYNRGAIGIYGATFIIFCFGSMLFKQLINSHVSLKIIYVATIVLSLLNIIFSGTRTGAFVSVLVILILFAINSIKTRKISLIAIISFLILGFLAANSLSKLSNDRFSKIGEDNSFGARLEVQQAAFYNSFENPYIFLFGNGIRSFSKINSKGFVHPRSEVFEVLYLTGWLGLICYLYLLVSILKTFIKSHDKRKFIYLGILLNGLIFGLLIGHFLIYEPRLASYGSFIFFTYMLLYFQSQPSKIRSDNAVNPSRRN